MNDAPRKFPGFSIAVSAGDAPVEAAARVTRNSASNLWAVGRYLPVGKRRLFEAAYASMRIVDDFVDDGFLELGHAARAEERNAARKAVGHWLDRCRSALTGEPGVDDPVDPLDCVGAGKIYRALSNAALVGAPSATPWVALATAMEHDIDERPLRYWPDFLDYCEGATVAPASVFLFVLAARQERKEGRFSCAFSDDQLFDMARPMAVFCYLVHILRDLSEDTARGGQLITLPADILEAHGLTREELSAGPIASNDATRALACDLAGRAQVYRLEMTELRDRLSESLGFKERMILGALTNVYETLHDRLSEDPTAAITGDPSIGKGIREDAFARFGLDGEIQ